MIPQHEVKANADAQNDLLEVRRIVLEYLKPWRVKVYLFGSQAILDVNPTNVVCGQSNEWLRH